MRKARALFPEAKPRPRCLPVEGLHALCQSLVRHRVLSRTAGENVQLISGEVVPGCNVRLEVLCDGFLRNMGKPVRKLRID
jgi:hypothetical protein